MTNETRPPRLLLWATVIVLFALSLSVYFGQEQLPPSIAINTEGQPTIGYNKAKVHVVIFEEPKCSHCRHFNNEIFPKIKKEFIDTDKILYTIIPVSFLQGSMPAAVAALCLYHENPRYPNDTLFFKYMDHLYHQETEQGLNINSIDELVALAQQVSPFLHPDELKKCIDAETYRIQVERNTDYGAQIMGGSIITPTVYVNGIKVQEISFEAIEELIKQALEHEGVY